MVLLKEQSDGILVEESSTLKAQKEKKWKIGKVEKSHKGEEQQKAPKACAGIKERGEIRQ